MEKSEEEKRREEWINGIPENASSKGKKREMNKGVRKEKKHRWK